MRLFLLSFIVTSLIGVSIPYTHVAGELTPLYNKYIDTLHTHCDIKFNGQFIIKFGETKDCIGYCERNSIRKVIVIDKNFWDRSSEFYRQILLWHELSHCELHAEHSVDKNNFMYPVLPIYITKAEFYSQVYELMEQKCNK